MFPVFKFTDFNIQSTDGLLHLDVYIRYMTLRQTCKAIWRKLEIYHTRHWTWETISKVFRYPSQYLTKPLFLHQFATLHIVLIEWSFLDIFQKWWKIANSKQRFPPNQLKATKNSFTKNFQIVWKIGPVCLLLLCMYTRQEKAMWS